MKLLILSDSHHCKNAVSTIICKNADADAIIFLGDGLNDYFEALEENGLNTYRPDKDIVFVYGNCDSYSRCMEHTTREYDSVRFYITHGCEENVKTGLWHLLESAACENCSVALYGHTHLQSLQEKDGIILFNPGAASSGRYGIVTIQNQKAVFETCSL